MFVTLLLIGLVLGPVIIGIIVARKVAPDGSLFDLRRLRRISAPKIAVGDHLVYRMDKVSPHPSTRALNVHPAEQGDDYYYEVPKYWTVSGVLDDGRLVAVTRRGKQHYLSPDDPKLRKARLIEQLRCRNRFPKLPASPSGL